MIIIDSNLSFKTFTQTRYNSLVSLVSFENLTCELCENSGFYHHGSYERMFFDGYNLIELNIYRVKCIGCGVTHSILLFPMIPYSRDAFILELYVHNSITTIHQRLIIYKRVCEGLKRKSEVVWIIPHERASFSMT